MARAPHPAVLAAGAVAAGVGAWALSRRGAGPIPAYPLHRRRWGPGWGAKRPPDLPAGARRPSKGRAALPYILKIAKPAGGPAFALVVADLARTESGGIFGRPARPPYASRHGWGAFQWDLPAWRHEGRKDRMWEATPAEELRVPIRRYLKLWSAVKRKGGSDLDAARAVRLWHRGPAYTKRYMKGAARAGSFPKAWAAYRKKATGRAAKSLQRTDSDMLRIGLAKAA